jgi:PAS domain S-box-containing protein
VAVAAAVSLTPVGAFLVLAGPRFTRGLDGGDLVVLLLAIAAATLLVSPTRDVVTRVLDRYLYRTPASVGTTLREASNTLTRVLDLDPLLQFVGQQVSASTEAEGVAIYVEAQDELRLAAERVRAAGPEFAAPSTLPGPLRRALVTCGDCVVTDEVVRRSDTAESRQLHGALQQLHWALLLPLVSARKVIGAIAVGPKLSGDPFYPHDLDLLMTLANQAGIAVKNAQLYTEVVVANEHLQNIVSTIESGVVAVDRAGRVSMFNPAAERLTGIPARAVQGHPLQDLPPALAEPLRAAAAEGQARAGWELALPGEGAARSIMGATAPLRDPAGGMLGAVTVLSDLTAVKALEGERRRAERLAQFEVLAASIAHEIKNPLVAIKTFAQLLTRKVQGERFVDEFGRVVTREIGRMERLVDRLRMLARPSDRPRQVLDLRRPVREAVEFLQPAFEEKRIALAVEVPPQAVLVEGDASELEALVVNLLLNAHEVTPPEGVVRIGLQASGQVLCISIDDSGPGIPPEAIDRIFDPFYSTKPRGSGLGLTICAGIAAAHHAKLRASNKPAGGALFTVEFSTATLTAPVGGGASTPA